MINKIQRIMALTGSVNGNLDANGSNGSLNKLCTKNTAKEYLDKNLTILYPRTVPILEHNSNNANDPSNTNGNSYHKKKLYPWKYA